MAVEKTNVLINLNSCSKENILLNGGKIIENQDGTVSVFVNNNFQGINTQLVPQPITSDGCCKQLDSSYIFDPIKQKCYWQEPSQVPCNVNNTFKLVLNPNGNDGAIFTDVIEETCTLDIEFDYLFKFECETLSLINGGTNTTCPTVSSVFENIAASALIETIEQSGNSTITNTVYSEEFFSPIGIGNLYTYLNGKSADTAFYICGNLSQNLSDTKCYELDLYNLDVDGDTINCVNVKDQLLSQLSTQANIPSTSATFIENINSKAFASNWLNFSSEITDQNIIKLISNKKIKLSLQLSGSCVDMCVLIDNIRLNRNCTRVTRKDIFSSKIPGFNLDRIRDNKKSWIATTETTTRREHLITKSDGAQPIRYTDYTLEDERQVINSKEIDLDINIAAAIETDVWCYISDNPCLLTGETINTTFCYKDVGYYFSGTSVLTAITSSTSVSQVLCITSTTVPTTIAYTCPAGFTATSGNEICQKFDTYSPQFTTKGPFVTAGSKLNTYSSSVYFYPSIENNGALPVYYQSGGGQPLLDQTGGTITALAIDSTNGFWVSNGSSTNGRLNISSVSAETNQWAGFSQCIDVTQGGTYYIGIGADDYIKLKVDGKQVILFSGTSYNSAISERWSVFPFYLTSGKHVIEVEGLNGGAAGGFGFEIYRPSSFATLTGATSSASTQANLIFSTVSRIGTNYDLSSSATTLFTPNIGYKCLDGFVVNTCQPQVSCTKIINSAITTTTIPSYVLTGYCNEVRAITSTTTPYNVLFGTYGCPAGFTATPGNDICQRITTVPATFNGSNGPTITRGSVNILYGDAGTIFYGNLNNQTALPLVYSGQSTILTNQTGGTITPITTVNSGTFWYNPSTNTGGRLNNVNITSVENEWLGFTKCIDIPRSGTYYIGVGADNYCQFSVDGVLYVALTGNTASLPLPNPSASDNLTNFRYWSVFEFNFTSGKHIITMLGLNQNGPGSFGAEVYDPVSFSVLTSAVSEEEVGLIFSTKNQVGKTYAVGQTIGFSCPAGFSVSNCDGEIPTCQLIESSAITLTLSSDTKFQTNSGFCRDNALSCVTPTFSTQTITNTGYSFTTATTVINECQPKIYCCSEYCGDNQVHINLQSLFTESLTDVLTIEDFQHYVRSQLIDVKNRQTIQSYPTLRLLYERYMNSLSFCNTKSSAFDYKTMDNFANLVGNYWVDLIEQVVPATTIWGSTKIYTNTIFDTQKFNYKSYTLFFGQDTKKDVKVTNPVTGDSCNVDVTVRTLRNDLISGNTSFNQLSKKTEYSNVYVKQLNPSSEFISFIDIVGPVSPCNQTNGVNDCLLQTTISDTILTNGKINANVLGATSQPTYLWTPTQETTQSIGNLTAGTLYTVTVKDECCEAKATFNATCTLSLTTTPVNPGNGFLGSVTVNALGARGALSYVWKSGTTVIGTTATVGGLSAGTYNVTVIDSGLIACSATTTTTLI